MSFTRFHSCFFTTTIISSALWKTCWQLSPLYLLIVFAPYSDIGCTMSATHYSSFLDLEAAVDRTSGSGEEDDEDNLEECNVWLKLTGRSKEKGVEDNDKGVEDDNWEETQETVSHWEETHGVVLPRLQECLGVGSLWRVGFKAGTKGEAANRAQHQFRKFNLPIHSVNNTISHILHSIPGALKTRNGLRRYLITTCEWDKIMNTSTTVSLNRGDWVQIIAGPYKGDPAIVKGADPEEHSGSICVLIIPHIHLDKTALKSAKRKRASAP
ncbi:hypothetical protein BJ165DRAFT_1405109 [Panaeolus papilionaceus]|nr:hypothetical protein BJ165DRAFT_1405109 [Panaeolus papilionaceus]